MEEGNYTAETSCSIGDADVDNPIPTATRQLAVVDLLGKNAKPTAIALQTPPSAASTVDDTVMFMNSDASSDEEISPDAEDEEAAVAALAKSDKEKQYTRKCCADSAVHARWVNLMDTLRNCITDAVLCITNHAATNPYSYMFGITLLSFGLLGTGFATNFDMSVVADESYTSKNSIIREQKEWINSLSGFPPPPLSIRMMIHAQGDNVLTQQGVHHAFQVMQEVENTPEYGSVCSDQLLQKHYNTGKGGYVGGYSSECHIRGVTMLWNNSRAILDDEVQSDTDVLLGVSAKKFPDGSDMDSREILGKPTHQRGAIESAESILMEFMIPGAHAKSPVLKQAVLEKLLELRKDWSSQSKPFDLEVFTGASLEQETTRAVMKDLPLIAIVFVTMALFTCAVFSSNTSSSSHMLLGLGAVICVAFSLASSYGILYIIGVPFTSLTQILPFIMFGIGLDDSFIIFGEYSRTDPEKEPAKRIHDTFEEIGLSIVLTKLTTTIAFALGCCSNIPTLFWLSCYAFPTVLVDFAYQITFFVALVVLDDRRTKAGRWDCFICLPVTSSHTMDTTAVMGEDSSRASLSSSTPSNITDEAAIIVGEYEPGRSGSASKTGQQRSRVDRFMCWYSDQLLRPSVKFLVVTFFLAMTAGLTYSATLFTQEFNLMEMLPSDSFVKDYLSAMETHGERGFIIPSAYFRGVDQSDPDIQLQMEGYVDDISSMNSISQPPPYFWLRHFRLFLTFDDRLLDMTFNQQMDIFLSIEHFRLLYGDHIIRDSESGDIIASRCVIYMDNVDLNAVANQTAAWDEQRDATAMQPVNMQLEPDQEEKFFIYEPTMMYVWEFYSQIVDELISTTVLGVIAVSIICFFFIPHYSATLFLFPVIAVLYVDLIGFLQVFQVHLNAVSFFSLVMSIGLLVDFNMHILLRYYEAPCATREGKVKDALQTMGSSVMIGGFSTFLGVLPLLFSSSELMTTLFYGFLGMVLLGCSHGLILLPVILSMLGPIETVGAKRKHLPEDNGMLSESAPASSASSLSSDESVSSIYTTSTAKRNGSDWELPVSIQLNEKERTILPPSTAASLAEKRMEADLIDLYSEQPIMSGKTAQMLPVAMEYDASLFTPVLCDKAPFSDCKEEDNAGVEKYGMIEKDCIPVDLSEELPDATGLAHLEENLLTPSSPDLVGINCVSEMLKKATTMDVSCPSSPHLKSNDVEAGQVGDDESVETEEDIRETLQNDSNGARTAHDSATTSTDDESITEENEVVRDDVDHDNDSLDTATTIDATMQAEAQKDIVHQIAKAKSISEHSDDAQENNTCGEDLPEVQEQPTANHLCNVSTNGDRAARDSAALLAATGVQEDSCAEVPSPATPVVSDSITGIPEEVATKEQVETKTTDANTPITDVEISTGNNQYLRAKSDVPAEVEVEENGDAGEPILNSSQCQDQTSGETEGSSAYTTTDLCATTVEGAALRKLTI